MEVKLTKRSPLATRIAVPLVAAALALAAAPGCDDSSNAIRTYDAPRDVSAPAQTIADASTSPTHDEAPLQWKVPEGWKRMPDRQMRYATFQVSPDHPDVELSVIPLPLDVNPLLPNVNRWEDQLGLAKTAESDLAKVVTTVKLADGTSADTVDLTGKDAKTGQPSRLLGARVPHDDQAWFFKLMGSPEVVGAQKANFDALIRSIEFHAHDHAEAPSANVASPPAEAGGPGTVAAPIGSPTKLVWDKLPDGWTEEKVDKPFRVHTFQVKQGSSVAEVAVTPMTREQAGSILDNINRWRGSIGLPPTQDPSAHPEREATVASRTGFRIDVKGPQQSVFVGLTSAGDRLWFFKMTGPNPLMEAQSAAFDAFLSAVRFAPSQQQQ
jgi:hypothetical protein